MLSLNKVYKTNLLTYIKYICLSTNVKNSKTKKQKQITVTSQCRRRPDTKKKKKKKK